MTIYVDNFARNEYETNKQESGLSLRVDKLGAISAAPFEKYSAPDQRPAGPDLKATLIYLV